MPGQPDKSSMVRLTSPQPDADEATEERARPVSYPHEPFKKRECNGCHDLNTGQLVQTIRDGLCQRCHSETMGQANYVHGPVAINDCTMCHHFHASPHPKLLLKGPNELCLHCHNLKDLPQEPCMASIETQTCIDCHDPHESPERFLLVRSEQ
jgi:predicted CXXCH cytochrome family protein